MRSRVISLLSAALTLSGAAQAVGQVAPSISGRVLELDGRPLAGVELLLSRGARTAVTNASGAFEFANLPSGDYALTARMIGYVPNRMTVSLQADASVELEIRLEPRMQELETVIVEGTRRGLYGVVSDSTMKAISGVRLDLHGGGARQVSDSAGRFAFPGARPGAYLLVATAPGLVAPPLHLTVPSKGAREVSLTMRAPLPGRADPPGMYWVYHDLGVRFIRYPSSKRMDIDELRPFSGRPLCDVARIRAVVGGDVATVVLNGNRVLSAWSLCEFSVDEVGLVEWTACVSLGRAVTSPGVLRLRTGSQRGQASCLMIWLR